MTLNVLDSLKLWHFSNALRSRRRLQLYRRAFWIRASNHFSWRKECNWRHWSSERLKTNKKSNSNFLFLAFVRRRIWAIAKHHSGGLFLVLLNLLGPVPTIFVWFLMRNFAFTPRFVYYFFQGVPLKNFWKSSLNLTLDWKILWILIFYIMPFFEYPQKLLIINCFKNIQDSDYLAYCKRKRKRVKASNTKEMKAKLFQFVDNYRPPYFGTWRRRSVYITGRRPLSRKERVRVGRIV